MRFFADGPAIPNELLQLSDQGEVVLFCGAGISRPAGLPGFFELTKRLMDKLKVGANSRIAKMMKSAIDADDPDLAPPLDQVLGLLQRDYTRERVQQLVAIELKVHRRSPTEAHKTVLRISRDAAHRPFIVTTNFDLLFEKAQPKLHAWSAPMLPRIGDDYSPTGVVYLHGRLTASKNDWHGDLVLSSSDFGRAYLADGWATSFMQQLLARRVVVLLGYSASDPPIRYLLEGLNAQQANKLKRIYAFDRGLDSDVSAKWRDLGVVGIGFSTFGDLWKSLSAWADRADDPLGWSQKVSTLAGRNPRELTPFQRGQVASLVSTAKGAKIFLEAPQTPPAEWIAVFDKRSRFGLPGKEGWGADARLVDPHDLFGLDDDIVPQKRDTDLQYIEAPDLLASQASEGLTGPIRLSHKGVVQLPPRLNALASWFERVAHEPAALWWAAKQATLHPHLAWLISQRLTNNERPFTDEIARIWSLLIEIHEQASDENEYRLFELAGRIKQRGWDCNNLRLLQRICSPRLSVNHIGSPTIPPMRDWDGRLVTLARFSVKCAVPTSEFGVPDTSVHRVFKGVVQNLIEAIGLLNETDDGAYFRLPSLAPNSRGGERYIAPHSLEGLFLWATTLFERLATLNVKLAKSEVATWPLPDVYFFDKLRIFAWRNAAFSGAEVGRGINDLTTDTFWNSYLQREILHLMRARWPDFSSNVRAEIEQRIIHGRDRYSQESEEDFEVRKKIQIGERLGWLEINGCSLTASASNLLHAIRADKKWRNEWQNTADHDMDGRVGWVELRKDPTPLLDAPMNSVAELAIQSSGRIADFVEADPFAGLVAQRPGRALVVLSLEARAKRYPHKLWQDLLNEWPESATSRHTRVCAARIAKLPNEVILGLRYESTRWIENNLQKIYELSRQEFWCVWDRVYSSLVMNGEQATRSAIVEIKGDDKQVERSRSTVMHAINSPIGHMVDTLFKISILKNIHKNEHLPFELRDRLEICLDAPGEGAHHAATLIGRRLKWLFFVDPNWTKRVLLPAFAMDSPLSEAAWSGLLFDAAIPEPGKLFSLLKNSFLSIFSSRPEWLANSNIGRQAGQMLIVANYWWPKSRSYVSDAQCTEALRATSDEVRQAALWMVGQIVQLPKTAGLSYGKRFFQGVWPQEARYQTTGTTRSMIHIATERPDDFAFIVGLVKPFLRALRHPDTFVFSVRHPAGGGGRSSIAERYPMEVLEVLDAIIATDSIHVPYELDKLLEEISSSSPEARSADAWSRLHDLSSQ